MTFTFKLCSQVHHKVVRSWWCVGVGACVCMFRDTEMSTGLLRKNFTFIDRLGRNLISHCFLPLLISLATFDSCMSIVYL